MGGGQSKLLATLDGFKYLETLKVSKCSSENKRGFTFGFTLAEVLITLGIIGVVVAITMPMLVTNVRNHIKTERIKNIEQKFSKATDKMVSLGVMTGYNSTEEFVNELGKHLKLAKVCNNDNLKSCWPYEKVLTRVSTNTLWDIADTKTASKLKMENDDYSEWDKTMGIIIADGTSMILSYNKKCDIDETKPITYGGSVSSTTGCVAVVYDWNGATKPNKYGDDVLSINARGLNDSCSIEIGDLCIGAIHDAVAVTKEECEQLIINKYGIRSCYYNNDYWAGAVKQCGGTDKMLTQAQLKQFADYLYTKEWESAKESGNETLANAILSKQVATINLPDLSFGSFYLWSVEERSSTQAYGRTFDFNGSSWNGYIYRNGRLSGNQKIVCLSD